MIRTAEGVTAGRWRSRVGHAGRATQQRAANRTAPAPSARVERHPGCARVLAGAVIWYTADVIRAHPVAAVAVEVSEGGSGVTSDGRPGHTVHHIPYAPGGRARIEVTIENRGHYAAHVRLIRFFGIPTSGEADHFASPLRSAQPLSQPETGSDPLDVFRAFTLEPAEAAVIGWDLTMCPTAQPTPGRSRIVEDVGISYSYGGWTRMDAVLLPARVHIDNANECDWKGDPA